MYTKESVLPEWSAVSPVRQLLSLGGNLMPKFQIHTPDSRTRAEVEAYIHNKFKRSYDARIDAFMPNLLTVSCNDSYSAALGIRNAGSGRLYLENYLEDSIESVLSQRLSVDTQRHRLVEIGNLVSTWRGSSQIMFLFLALLLQRIGCDWVAFTATEEIGKLIQKMHFDAHTLCEAKRERVGGDVGKWGSYYETRPHVMAGHVPGACAVIRKHALTAALAKALAPQVERIAQFMGTRP